MHSLGYIYAIGAAFAWGLAYTIDQKILGDISPAVLLFLSFVIGALLLVPAILLGRDMRSLTTLAASGNIMRMGLILLSICLATLANYLIFSSIQKLGAASASIFEIAYPLFVVLFSFFLFGTTLNGYFLIGALMIFLGSAIIIRLG